MWWTARYGPRASSGAPASRPRRSRVGSPRRGRPRADRRTIRFPACCAAVSRFPVRAALAHRGVSLGQGRRAGVALEVDPREPGADDLPALLLQAGARSGRHDADPAVLPLGRGVLEGVLVCAEAHRVPAVPAGDAQGVHLGERGDRADDAAPGRVVLVHGRPNRWCAAWRLIPRTRPMASQLAPAARADVTASPSRLRVSVPARGRDVDQLEELVAVRFGLLGAGHPGQRGRQGLPQVDRLRRPGRQVPALGRAHAVNARLTRWLSTSLTGLVDVAPLLQRALRTASCSSAAAALGPSLSRAGARARR